MKEHPKEQAQTQWLNRLQPFSIDTHPNLRQATIKGSIELPIIFQPTYPRGTEWQEQLFRLASERVEG